MAQFLLSHKGTITGVEDFFVHTLVVSGDGTTQEVAETARDLFRDSFFDDTNGIATVTSATVQYTEVAAAEILSLLDGDLSAAYHAEFAPGDAVSGTVTSVLPAQSACAVSLTAGLRANGTPIKGRFYMPPAGAGTLTAGGLYTESYTGRILSRTVAYVQALATAGLDAGVWSRSTATFSTLTQVRVGDHPDTIRSRRNAVPETYQVSAV